MELKHLTIAVATALGLSTAAMAQTGDMGKQRGTTSEPSASATQGMASSDDVRQVQQELQNRGFNVGTVDGVMGPQTKGALKEFQQAEGLPATGELNEKTKSQLKTSSAGSRASGTTGVDRRERHDGLAQQRPDDRLVEQPQCAEHQLLGFAGRVEPRDTGKRAARRQRG